MTPEGEGNQESTADERRHRADEQETFLKAALRAQGISVDVDALERARRVQR